MSTTAKEAAEEVERIIAASSLPAELVLFHSVMAILIVYLARLRVDKGVVGFSDLDELLVGGVIVWVLVWVVLLRKSTISFLDLAIVGVFVESEELNQRLVHDDCLEVSDSLTL